MKTIRYISVMAVHQRGQRRQHHRRFSGATKLDGDKRRRDRQVEIQIKDAASFLHSVDDDDESPAMADLCLLMWPPRAWPEANSDPHISCTLVAGTGDDSFSFSYFSGVAVAVAVFGFLWPARWPPRA